MSKLSTYHLHTTFSDGEFPPERMLEVAVNYKCPEIGFSDHAPMDFDCCWSMKKEAIPSYISTLEALREQNKDKIKVYIGIEQDYFSPELDWKPDFIIGSVHFILKDGHYLEVDKSAEVMKYNIDTYYGGDVYAYCEDYFALVADVYNKTKCDIIGHLDLVTKFNEKMPIIDETHPRYVSALNKAIEALIKTPATFEINTGAIARGYRTKPYPSESTIMRLRDMGERFVINSDTHTDYTLDYNLNEYARIFDMLGIKYIRSLDEILREQK